MSRKRDRSPPPPPCLLLDDGAVRQPLDTLPFVMGRGVECTHQFRGKLISRVHATIKWSEAHQRLVLEDRSTNGIFIVTEGGTPGERIEATALHPPFVLEDGHQLLLGRRGRGGAAYSRGGGGGCRRESSRWRGGCC